MKQLFLLFAGVTTLIAMLLSACSNVDTPIENLTDNVPVSSDDHGISKADAEKIAARVLGASRAESLPAPTYQYVIGKSKSRGAAADTIAYVMNYGDDNGFAIISADNRVYPLLAFSYDGNFSFDNELAKEQFIDRLDDYIEQSAISGESYSPDEVSLAECNITPSNTSFRMSQGEPYNKYVTKHHPGWPVGCVPVAMVQTMMYSKDVVKVGDKHYFLWKIVDAYEEYYSNNSNSTASNGISPQGFEFGDLQPYDPIIGPYNISQAVDRIAEMLDRLGQILPVNYRRNESGEKRASAGFTRSHNVFEELGYQSLNEVTRYSKNAVMLYAKAGHIVMMCGDDLLDVGTSHAWIIDGCIYCNTNHGLDIVPPQYLYCKWGWGSTGDGYYTGDVFEVNDDNGNMVSKLQGTYFYAIKNEHIK